MNKLKTTLATVTGISAFALASSATAADSMTAYGPHKGDWEMTLGGNGSNDKNFDNGGFGANASVGYFITDNFEATVRQGLNYSDFNNNSFWDGSTVGAIDYHFNLDRFRPFIGANFGGAYGEGTTDSWGAGLEAGAKYYVKKQTFLFAMGQYQWLFNDADNFGNRFDDGRFVYSLGIGFNF